MHTDIPHHNIMHHHTYLVEAQSYHEQSQPIMNMCDLITDLMVQRDRKGVQTDRPKVTLNRCGINGPLQVTLNRFGSFCPIRILGPSLDQFDTSNYFPCVARK